MKNKHRWNWKIYEEIFFITHSFKSEWLNEPRANKKAEEESRIYKKLSNLRPGTREDDIELGIETVQPSILYR